MKPLAAPAILLTAAIFIFQGRIIGNDFVAFDDPLVVTENPYVFGGLTLQNAKWAFTTGHFANWAPLTWLSHQLDATLFGAWAGGHHLTSLLLHVVGTLAVLYGFANALESPWTACLLAALYALHPLHVESIAWVSERKGILSSAFGLWAIAVYLAATKHRLAIGDSKRMMPWLVCALQAASLASKQMFVTLPALLLLLDVWPLRRKVQWSLVVEKWPSFALSVVFAWIAYWAQSGGGAISSLAEFPLPDRLANSALAIAHYIGDWTWPSCLGPFYPVRPPSLRSDGQSICLAIAVALVFAGLGVASKNARPMLRFGLAWFVIALLPVAGLIPIGRHARADRYTDIPLLGLNAIVAMLIAKWLHGANSTSGGRTPAVALSCTLLLWLVLLASKSFVQTRHWQDTETLFTAVLRCDPNNYMANNQLGVVRLDQRRVEAALAHFETAVRADPTFAFAHINVGRAQRRLNNHQAAERAFAAAMQADENLALAWHEHALALAELGEDEAAAAELERACQLDPNDGQAWINLGSLRLRLKRPIDAIAAFERGLAVKPASLQGRFDLARAWFAIGESAKAAALQRELASEFPDNAAVARLGEDLRRNP